MFKLKVDHCEREHGENEILDEKNKILDFNLVNRCVCEHEKRYEKVYTDFPFEKKEKIYLYNNTTTTFTIAYVPNAYAPAVNTIKLETPLVKMPRYITTLKCGEYAVVKKEKENRYDDLVEKISEGAYEESAKRADDDEAFYYISINEFLPQKDDRKVLRISKERRS